MAHLGFWSLGFRVQGLRCRLDKSMGIGFGQSGPQFGCFHCEKPSARALEPVRYGVLKWWQAAKVKRSGSSGSRTAGVMSVCSSLSPKLLKLHHPGLEVAAKRNSIPAKRGGASARRCDVSGLLCLAPGAAMRNARPERSTVAMSLCRPFADSWDSAREKEPHCKGLC